MSGDKNTDEKISSEVMEEKVAILNIKTVETPTAMQRFLMEKKLDFQIAEDPSQERFTEKQWAFQCALLLALYGKTSKEMKRFLLEMSITRKVVATAIDTKISIFNISDPVTKEKIYGSVIKFLLNYKEPPKKEAGEKEKKEKDSNGPETTSQPPAELQTHLSFLQTVSYEVGDIMLDNVLLDFEKIEQIATKIRSTPLLIRVVESGWYKNPELDKRAEIASSFLEKGSINVFCDFVIETITRLMKQYGLAGYEFLVACARFFVEAGAINFNLKPEGPSLPI